MSKFTIQFKQYWKNFGSYNKMRFVKSGMYFFVGALGLILLSAFSQKLSMLDIGLAKWAQANASNDHTSLFNTGAIQFVNEKQTPIFWMAFSFLVILFGFDLIVLRLKFKEHLMKYSYIICSALAFVAISTILVQAMKFSFHRPRPTHTVDYHSPLDTDLSCKLAFHTAFRVYKGPNPCDYSLQSCPSGHTQGTATSCFVMLWFALFNLKFTRKYTTKSVLNCCFNLCMIILASCLTIILVPSVTVVAKPTLISKNTNYFKTIFCINFNYIQLWEVELLFLVYYVSNYILKYFATSNADDKFQQIISSWRLFMNYSLTQEGQKYDFDRIRPQSTIQSRYLIFQKGKIEITTCNKGRQ
ncbi:PAP2_superfamily protein [Hexamita inflata]|uniref:PAP2 superfamily protein n=1 Tax=Hexamita inflata TaxID=28002 RepID=A0AA86PEY6_9EUKA|nr:PAP2 superfamily protein [Hexamita inflata]